MLVPIQPRERSMLTYNDISKRYQNYRNAEMGYWRGLQKAAQQLYSELRDSLELTSPTWDNSDGQKVDYMALGVFAGDRFEAKPSALLEGRQDRSLPFAIRITLEEGPNVLPKVDYVQQVRVWQSGAVIAVELGAQNPIQMAVTNEDVPGRFADVAEAIKRQLVAALDPTVFAKLY